MLEPLKTELGAPELLSPARAICEVLSIVIHNARHRCLQQKVEEHVIFHLQSISCLRHMQHITNQWQDSHS